jgi:hypothetical protein
VAPGVDARVARLVDRALEFSKEGRWPNTLAMRRPLQEVYQDLYGHPIDDAPKLIFSADVPADIAQEEPSSVPALSRRVPTPTQLSPAGLSRSRARARGVAIGGAAAVGLLVGTLLVLAGWHTEGRAQATSSPRPMSDPRPMAAPSTAPQPFPEQRFPEIVSEPPPSPPVIAPPIVSVSQASAPKRPALSPTPSRVLNAQAPIPQAPSAEVPVPQSPIAVAPNIETPAANVPSAQVPREETPNAQAECSPPYVVDSATGKKRWKLECL